MIHALLRGLFGRLLSLYYPVLVVDGRDRVPEGVPVLAVLNHPNGLLDPLVLRIALGRPIAFLGKSTLFGNPVGRLAMDAFGAIPVYRHRDKDAGGGDPSKNDETFARCRARLGKGGWVALFPEGTSHSDPQMKPLKTGAARIALGAVDEQPGARDLVILPAGLYYEEKATFRSRVLLSIGDPIAVAPLLAQWKEDDRGTVNALTDAIRAGLDRVVLQAENRELLEGIARVADFTVARSRSHGDGLARQHQRALVLRDAYARWSVTDPARVTAVTEAAQRYFKLLQAIGVEDPWSLEVLEVTTADVVRVTATLVVMAPFALVGAALGWVPYRLAGVVAKRVAKDADDVLGTMKLLGGALFVLVYWALEVALVGWRFGGVAALLVALAAPACGYLALRFEERLDRALAALRHLQLRRRHVDVVRAVTERRKQLTEAIEAMLAPPPGESS